MCCRHSEKIARAVALTMINSELEGTKKFREMCIKEGRTEELKYWNDSIANLESIKKKY